MADYTVWMLEAGSITVGGGGSLNGVTQGDGSHLVGLSITLINDNWLETFITDDDPDFEDNDSTQQTLSGPQSINGTDYAGGQRVEAEYQLTVTDGVSTWTAYAYNVNNSAPAYATIEGLVFLPDANGNYPPVGVPLTVTDAGEGPAGLTSNPYLVFEEPPCFTLGTLIDTPSGPKAIEYLQPGDLVLTRDNGAQPLRWIGRVHLTAGHLALHPEHQPVAIAAGALSAGLPARTLSLSPQHRLLVSGWKAELLFAQLEVLVPVTALRNDRDIRTSPAKASVTYLHLLFDQHEIIFAEGAAVESLHAPWLTRTTLPPALRAELEALFPEIFNGTGTVAPARPCLSVTEGRILVY